MEEINIKAPEVGPNADALTSLTRGRGPRRGNLEDLLKYWRPIMKRPGGFRRCVITLMDKPQFGGKPQRICAWLHHELTGKWPNEGKGKRGSGGGRRRGKLTRRVRRGRRGKSLDFNAYNGPLQVNALSVAVRESREAKSLLTQPINGSQNAIDYKASLIRMYSAHVEFEGKTLEVDDDRLQVKRVGLFGSSSRAGQAVQAVGSIALPGDLSDIRSPVRSQIYEALTPGIPGRPRIPGRGALRRAGRGARNKFRCPPGFEKGGTFTNSEFSTCGAQILRIPNGLGGLAPDAQRSLARLARDADLVRTIGDLRKNKNSADIIRAAQIPSAPKKVNATNMKKSTDYVLSRIADGEAATDRVVRRDGVILEPVVSTAAIGGLDEFDDMADGSYIATSRTGILGADEIPMFSTGIRDILFPIGDAGAIRLSREGGELSPDEREGLREAAREAARSVEDGADPTAALRQFVDNSDGRFKLELLAPTGEGETRDYVPAEERMNERIKVRSGSETVIVPRWVYETFLSRGAPRRAPNDPIFEIEDENGGSKSASPFFSTDASRHNKRYDLKAYWFKRETETKARRGANSVFDVNLGRYRCPPGTQNGGSFTDNAGTNCGGRISDKLVDSLSRLFDHAQRITDRTDKYGAQYARRSGASSEAKDQIDQATTLSGSVAKRTRDLVEDVGPVKLSELGETIDEIQLARSLSPEESKLASGESLLSAATMLNIQVTEELGDEIDNLSAEEMKQIIDAVSEVATAEAARRTISGNDEASRTRSSAIESLLEEAIDFIVNATRTGKKPRRDEEDDTPSLPETSSESVLLQVEEVVGHADIDPEAEGILTAMIATDEDYSDVARAVSTIKDDLLVDISVFSDAPLGSKERDILEGALAKLDVPEDRSLINEDVMEENEYLSQILRDYIELDAISKAMEDPMEQANLEEIGRLFSRTSPDTRSVVLDSISPALSGDTLSNDELLQGLLEAAGSVELDERLQRQSQRRLSIAPDADFLPIEAVSDLSASRKVKKKQSERVAQILRDAYPDGRTPWQLEEGQTLVDLVDFDKLTDPDVPFEEKRDDVEKLQMWLQDALRLGEEIELQSIDIPTDMMVADGKTVGELYPDGLRAKLVTKLVANYESEDAFEIMGDRIFFGVSSVWETSMVFEDKNGVRRQVMSNMPDGEILPFDQDVARNVTLRRDGSIEIDNEVFVAKNGSIPSDGIVNGSGYPRAMIKKVFNSMSPKSDESGNDLEITGYGIADKINMHSFVYYAAASRSAPTPAKVTLSAGHDGAAVWGRKGFRDTRELKLLRVNEDMQRLIEAYERNDDSIASRAARAIIKDDKRLGRIKSLVEPYERGATGDALAGHGDFQLALDEDDGTPNTVAFFYFKGQTETFYTPKSKLEQLRIELEDQDEELYKLMAGDYDRDTAKAIENGQISESDFKISDDAKLSTSSFTIDHLDDIVAPQSVDESTTGRYSPLEARSTTVPNGSVFDVVADREDMATVDQAISFLEDGGSVAEVPDSVLADTLITAANDDSVPRFTKQGDAFGASEVQIITDNLTGITYGIKGTNGILFPNEAAAEVIGPHVASLLGFKTGSVRLGGSARKPSRNTDYNPYDTYPIVIQFADSMFGDWKSRTEPGEAHDLTASKKSLANMMLLDIIVSHRDRNPRNYGVGDGEYFPFDYGGALALIEGPDRAYFNQNLRTSEAEYLDDKIRQAGTRFGSPFFTYLSLVGEREDLSGEELGDLMWETLEELRAKDLDQLRDLARRLRDMQLDEFRGSSFDRPVTDPDAIERSYLFPVAMIEHLLGKDETQIRALGRNIHALIQEKKDSLPVVKGIE